MNSIVRAGSACPITKLALAATLGLAITLTLTACEEKEKKQTASETAPEPAAEAATQQAATAPTTFTDPRDNKTYKTVKIGTQTWLAENLNFEAKGSKCYDNKPDNCKKYGRLYDWNAAMKACPSGWKLPSNEEWQTLVDFADGELKSNSGFSALPGGGYSYGSFQNIGSYGNWWSSSEDGSNDAISRTMIDDSFGNDLSSKSYLFSIRCIQGEAKTTAPAETASGSTLTDPRDNKTYKTVKIGNQTWMAENLNIDLPSSKCYDNKPANCKKYGRLYDWKTAMKACPSGWHLPSQQEWESLASAIDGDISNDDCAGCYDITKLKSKNGWNASNNGTDDYGFSALPSGRYGDCGDRGDFCDVGVIGLWWTATTADTEETAYIWMMSGFYTEIYNNSYKIAGLSVRCIKD